MTPLDRAASIADLRRLARRRLPHSVFDFIDGGAGDELTLRRNEADFDLIGLRPRVGVDVSSRSARTRILGATAELPLVIAPTGLAGLYWPDGEAAAARAAKAFGVPFCLSTNSVASIEEVAAAVGESERWFQLYFLKDRALMERMLERAGASGCRALCVTLDLAVQGRRERDVRNGFTAPLKLRADTALDLLRRPSWVLGYLGSRIRFGNFETDAPMKGFSSVAEHVASLFDASADWDAVAAIMAKWDGPVALKGILHPDDARKGVELGADAIIVSNHGGRQLDHVPSAIGALPGVVEAVEGRAQVLLDGGVRHASDIVKAKALGADACMIGRGFLWGLAAAGEPGVRRALSIFRDELDIALALLGAPEFERIGPEVVDRGGFG